MEIIARHQQVEESKLLPREEFNLVWKDLLEKATKAIHTQFKPLPSDIILASYPKTGTTWLKALTTSILNLHKNKLLNTHDLLQVVDPLLTQNPHELIPFLEVECFGEHPIFDVSKMTSTTPRVFNTHIPYTQLPKSIKEIGCKMVYITRNPMDTLISVHFFHKKFIIDNTLEEDLENFCKGVHPYGSYFDHVLEYWHACNEKIETKNNNKFLFLTYEELKKDPNMHVKKLADFIGCSLDPNEVEQVVKMSSFDRLSKLSVNKDGSKAHWSGWDFSLFFRRGIVNDSRNYLTFDMVEQVSKMAREKWQGEEDLRIRLMDLNYDTTSVSK